MTATLLPTYKKDKTETKLSSSHNFVSLSGSKVGVPSTTFNSTRPKLSPTSSETENEPTSSNITTTTNNNTQSTMDEAAKNLILNTNFDFHSPTFSSHQLLHQNHNNNNNNKRKRASVTDHVLPDGERVVMVDPNVSEGEEDADFDEMALKIGTNHHAQPILPLDKAISTLFGNVSTLPPPQSSSSANKQQPPTRRKRSISPEPKTVSGILAAKRRKMVGDSSPPESYLSTLTSMPSSSRRRKTTQPRSSPNQFEITHATSKSSLSDSGIVSADEQQTSTTDSSPKMGRGSPSSKGQGSSDETSIPAPILQLLINSTGADPNHMNLSELLSSDPSLLKSINDVISANPAQPHTLQIVPTPLKTEPDDVPYESSLAFGKQSGGNKMSSQLPSAEQISAALALWPTVIEAASKLDDQTAAKILSATSQGQSSSKTTTSQLNNNNHQQPKIKNEPKDFDESNEDLLRLSGEWLLRELFKGKPLLEQPQQFQKFTPPTVTPPPPPSQPARKPKLQPVINSPHLKSSESVSSQLKLRKGLGNIAELEELETFAAHFKRQRIKHGFTQGDVGVALGKRFGSDFSQTTISRFEALNLSYKNMCKLRPLMEEWLNEAEAAIQRGLSVSDIVEADSTKMVDHVPDSMTLKTEHQFDELLPTTTTTLNTEIPAVNGKSMSDSSLSPGLFSTSTVPGLNNVLPTLKRRRKRTNLDTQQRERLDTYFNVNFRPDHQEMINIATELDLDPDVVRVWFCNRRQKLRKV